MPPKRSIESKIQELRNVQNRIKHLREEAKKSEYFLANLERAVRKARENSVINMQYNVSDPRDESDYITCHATVNIDQETADALRPLVEKQRKRLLDEADALERKYSE